MDKKIRIAFISYRFSFGGVQKAMLLIAQYLYNRGYEFHFININCDDFLDAFKQYGCCRFIPDPNDTIRYLIDQKIDIVQVTNYPTGAYLAYLAGVKRIVERLDGPDSAFRFDKKPIDCLIASTEKVYEKAVELFPYKYIKKIFNGVEIISSLNSILQKKIGLDGNSLVIGYMGRIAEDKCLMKLIDLFTRVHSTHTNTKLLIIGSATKDVEAEYKSLLEERIARLGIAGDVQFVQTEQPQQYLGVIDIGVLVSGSYTGSDGKQYITHEGYPNALIEMCAMGIPIVTTNSGHVSDLVRDGDTGFVVGLDDMDSFYEKLSCFITDHKLLKDMGTNAKKHAEKYFNAATMTRQFEELYTYLISDQFSVDYPDSRRNIKNHYLGNQHQFTGRIEQQQKILVFRSGSVQYIPYIMDEISNHFENPEISVLTHQKNYNDAFQPADSIENVYCYSESDTFDYSLMADLVNQINLYQFDYLYFIYNDFLGRNADNITEVVNHLAIRQKILFTTICGQMRKFIFP